jgi:trehalose/maltose transport system substrate-binding protein
VTDNRNLRPRQILSDLREGRLSRRDFMLRAAALGFSASAINAFLIACGGGSATNTPASSAVGSAAASAAPSASAAGSAAASAAGSARPSASGAATTPSTGGTPSAGTPTRPASPGVATPGTPGGGTPGAGGGGTFTRENPPAVANAAQARQFTGQRVTYVGGQVGSDADFDQILTRKFTQDTGIQVNLVPGPPSATERYSQYQRTFQGQSADIDVMMIDVIWPSALAAFLVDLGPKLGDLARQNVEGIIQNNTVDGKLVGMPWFGDFGILYYRTDLMQKYNISAPPKTWQELQQAAQTIQQGEQGANPNFAGFVFQGNAYEGLTCNALEWFASNGAGTFIDNNRNVTLNSPTGVQVLNLLKGFVGTASPRGVTTYQEDQTAQAFTNGNAAFARNWPYMYTIANGAGSAVAGKFDVTALPAGQGQQPAGTLGGWQLGISRFSRAQDAAMEFVRYMCGPEVVAWRGVVGSYVPLQQAVLDNPAVQQAQPYLRNLANVTRVARPSNALGENYNQGSTIIFQAINNVLNGGDAAQQLQSAQSQLERLVRRA